MHFESRVLAEPQSPQTGWQHCSSRNALSGSNKPDKALRTLAMYFLNKKSGNQTFDTRGIKTLCLESLFQLKKLKVIRRNLWSNNLCRYLSQADFPFYSIISRCHDKVGEVSKADFLQAAKIKSSHVEYL